MLKQMVLAASVAMLLWPAASSGAQFESDKYGFSANFPDEPTVSKPKGSETDQQGNFIARMVMCTAAEQGEITALVTVDSYSVPTKLNVPADLKTMRDDFVRGMGAKLVSSSAGTRDGYRALFFVYDTQDHSAAGNGVAIIVPQKKPRTYLVVTMHTEAASTQQLSNLDEFFASFHLK